MQSKDVREVGPSRSIPRMIECVICKLIWSGEPSRAQIASPCHPRCRDSALGTAKLGQKAYRTALRLRQSNWLLRQLWRFITLSYNLIRKLVGAVWSIMRVALAVLTVPLVRKQRKPALMPSPRRITDRAPLLHAADSTPSSFSHLADQS